MSQLFYLQQPKKGFLPTPLQWSMLKKAIFAEISLFAAVKSPFYSVPVSAFLFPAPTKLGFFKVPFHVKQSSKWPRTFLLSVLL